LYSFFTSANGFSWIENVAKSNEHVSSVGQLMTIATERLICISSILHPARLNADAWPALLEMASNADLPPECSRA
jgi:hypothetical protein